MLLFDNTQFIEMLAAFFLLAINIIRTTCTILGHMKWRKAKEVDDKLHWKLVFPSDAEITS